ncbi:MAG: exodeoxyribonuclease VII large subunit, partial [Chlorobium limicola]|nr:exodeoxyribonuclease VII large subunit [Chlorobium limicola]
GYALVKKENRFITGSYGLGLSDRADILFHDGSVAVTVTGQPTS